MTAPIPVTTARRAGSWLGGTDERNYDNEAVRRQALTQLANDVPFIPLFFNVKVMISRPDLCGLSLDVSSRSGLKDIEKLDIGTCK